MKKILSLTLSVILVLSLSGCHRDNPVPTPQPTPTQNNSDNEEKTMTMLVDTADYKLTFDILGEWEEYAGTSSVRDMAQAVLYSTTDNADNNVFFYTLINKYQEKEGETFKDRIVEDIKSRYDSVEFSSVSDDNEGTRVTSIYKMTDGSDTIKNYQYSVLNNGYEISFVYSAPELIYDNQRGYINDMISTARFSLVEKTAEQ